jgi:bile acid-coenzyme A ligase
MARQSISRIVTGLAEAAPDRVVARDDAGTLTASELDRASSDLARAYLDLGVGQDSLVTVALPNTVEMVVVCAAIWKCGATPQPVSLGLDAAERAELEALVRPALVVGVPSAGAGGGADGVAAAGAGTPAGVGPAGGVPRVPAGWVPPPVAGDAPPLPDAWASSWKAPTSSGSTGRPKVVLAAAPALLDPTVAVAPFLPRDQVQLVAGPLTHSATFTYAFRGLLTGHELVLLPRFDERRVLRAIASHRVTWALLVPTMMHRLLRLPVGERAAADLSSLETVLHVGAPCPPDLKRRFMAWAGAERVVEVYAGSESNGVLSIRGDEWLEHPGSVGRPGGGTSVAVRSAEGDDLPAGTVGQVWLRREGGPTYRYLGGRSARTDDGWDTLGDLGRLDADGWLHLVDRADDVVLRGGVNVHPTEVERVLEGHPAVRGAVAFGVADDDLGQRIEAVVDVAGAGAGAGAGVTAEQLLAWARQRLDPERRPAALWLVDEPVRDDAGKTSRRAWAARAARLR